MRIMDIPGLLFREFSESFGQGKMYIGTAEMDSIICGRWQLREISPLHYCGGENTVGVLGYREIRQGHSFFSVWSKKPEGEIDHVGGPQAIFYIHTHLDDTGIWSVGQGRYLRERLWAQFHSYGYDPGHYLAPLIASIITRAYDFTRESYRKEYWEAQEKPNGDYTQPPK